MREETGVVEYQAALEDIKQIITFRTKICLSSSK